MKKLIALVTVCTILGGTAAFAGPKKPKDLWVCPMTGEAVKDHSNAGVGPVVNGRVVHFCCAGCDTPFNKLTAKEKKAKIAAAAKKEAAETKKG